MKTTTKVWTLRAFLIGSICFYGAAVFAPSVPAMLKGSVPSLIALFTPRETPENGDESGGIGGVLASDGTDNDGVLSEALVTVVDGGSVEEAMLEPEAYSAARPLIYDNYRMKNGDVISKLSVVYGLNDDTLISVNGIANSRFIPEGRVLLIPNQDGIMYKIQPDDTIETVAEKYKLSADEILKANEYFTSYVQEGDSLFIPGVKMDPNKLREINGDLFRWPTTNHYVTSKYGWRISPITGTRLFHNGIDIRGYTGAPIYAAMAGRVIVAGWDNVYGWHVVISHYDGYRTMYGHMSKINVKQGAYVGYGQRIGDVGNTGASTGPHLHFTVYKSGVTVNPRALMN